MAFDVAQIDELLGIAGPVGARLDLDQPVDNQALLDCIDVAERALAEESWGTRRWIVVRDERTRMALGELYRATASRPGSGMGDPHAAAAAGSGGAHEAPPATFLAEHLDEVPAIVIPTILDGSGQVDVPGSAIRAAWSFCLALRARDLGAVWIAVAPAAAAGVKELLRIPGDTTELALLAVARMKGDRPPGGASLAPARTITFFDRYGTTAERGPGVELLFADGPGTTAEVAIAAPPQRVWALVTDIDLPAQFSEEFLGAEWAGSERGAGAVFHGRNRNDVLGEWTVPCFVERCDEPHAFEWATSDPANPGARWRFDLEPLAGGGTRLRYSVVLGPGPSGITMAMEANPGKETRVIRRRLGDLHTNMARTVEGIRQLAEGR